MPTETTATTETGRTACDSHLFHQKCSPSWSAVLPIVMILFAVVIAITFQKFLSRPDAGSLTRPHTPPSPRLSMDSKPEIKLMLSIKREGGQKALRIVDIVTEHCYNLGLLLDLPEYLVKKEWKISREEDHSVKCQNILSKWLEGQGKFPITWRTFIEALKDIPLPKLAYELESILSPWKQHVMLHHTWGIFDTSHSDSPVWGLIRLSQLICN